MYNASLEDLNESGITLNMVQDELLFILSRGLNPMDESKDRDYLVLSRAGRTWGMNRKQRKLVLVAIRRMAKVASDNAEGRALGYVK